MRRFTIIALASFILSGCASSPYGNFLQTSAVDQTKIAEDAVKQITVLYPPARTALEIKQPTKDTFGTALLSGLREAGYAVKESEEKKLALTEEAQKEEPAPEVPTKVIPVQTSEFGMPLTYVLDRAGTTNFYRLTIQIDTQSLTRAYVEKDGETEPAGYWARKE